MAKNEISHEIAIDAIGDPDPQQNGDYENQLKLDVNEKGNAGELYQDQQNQPEDMEDQDNEQEFLEN